MGEETTDSDPFVISRVLDAPRDRIWQALTSPEQMQQWWSPTGFAMIAANMDLRVGGVFHCGLRSVDGYKMWGRFVYSEIVPPARIVFVNSFSNAAGGITRHPVVPTWPLETLITVTLDQQADNKTKLSVRWSAHNASELERKTFDASHVGMKATWTGTLDRLAAYLAKA